MKTIDVEFEEYPKDTFTITVSPVSLGVFEALHTAYPEAVGAFQAQGEATKLRALVAEFVKVAKPTKNGSTMTAERLLAIDPNLAIALMRQWHAGVRNVPLPLPRGSSATAPSPEQ